MLTGYVVAENAVEEARTDGDTAAAKVTIGAAEGCESLEQRVIRFAPGRSMVRGDAFRDEILYVVSGVGSLELGGTVHELEPDTGVYIRMGERYVVDNPGPGGLELVSVLAPGMNGPRSNRQVTVRFAEQPELRADAKRTFRYLVNQDAGCLDVTQFVGIVEPCRAPDHSHSYSTRSVTSSKAVGSRTSRTGGQSRSGPARAFISRPSRSTASRTSVPT